MSAWERNTQEASRAYGIGGKCPRNFITRTLESPPRQAGLEPGSLSITWESEAVGKARGRHQRWVPIREGGLPGAEPWNENWEEGALEEGERVEVTCRGTQWCKAQRHCQREGKRRQMGSWSFPEPSFLFTLFLLLL